MRVNKADESDPSPVGPTGPMLVRPPPQKRECDKHDDETLTRLRGSVKVRRASRNQSRRLFTLEISSSPSQHHLVDGGLSAQRPGHETDGHHEQLRRAHRNAS